MTIKPKKIEKNIYTIKGEEQDLNNFFKETILADFSENGLKVLWETDGMNVNDCDIIINPFAFSIQKEKLEYFQ